LPAKRYQDGGLSWQLIENKLEENILTSTLLKINKIPCVVNHKNLAMAAIGGHFRFIHNRGRAVGRRVLLRAP
jgi:hypothetical protein